MALEVLTKVIPLELMGIIMNKAIAIDVWNSLYLRNIGTEHVRKARANTLQQEFDALKFKDGEMIDNFGVHINSLTTQLAVLGTTYTNEEIVRCFLQALPPRFDQITTLIETLLDLADVSLDELIDQLKLVEEKMNRDDKKSVARLNLMEDKLMAHVSSCLKVDGSENSDSSNEGSSSGKRGRGHGHGRNNGGRGGTKGGGCTSNTGCRGNDSGGVTGG
jgi:hypothetical protein